MYSFFIITFTNCYHIMDMKYSKYQEAIFDAYMNTNKNLLISAVAGSGKTTTLIKLLEIAGPKKVLFCAFNRSIVEELLKRTPKTVKVTTLHSLGLYELKKKHNITINDNKILDMCNRIGIDTSHIKDIKKIIDLYRLTLIDKSEIEQLIRKEKSKASLDEVLVIIGMMESTYSQKSIEIDYTDMVYLPIYNNLKMEKYLEVFIDEAQDLNACQHELIKRVTYMRYIAVGDPNQSIYGFMGADLNSFNKFKGENTTELPLSVCYRCGTNILNEANKIYNCNESPDGMFNGEVMESDYKSLDSLELDSIIICRNNAPLVKIQRFLRGKGIECYIESDIEKELLNYIKYSNINDLKELLDGLDTESDLGSVLLELSEGCNNIKELISCIRKVFSDKTGTPMMTIHKSKGLEARVVYYHRVYGFGDYVQENNLKYVACTRAKEKLIYI